MIPVSLVSFYIASFAGKSVATLWYMYLKKPNYLFLKSKHDLNIKLRHICLW